jgi:nitrile hydratase accessory protein
VSAEVLFGADVTGPEVPPRRNGEFVFDAPWEGRAFGIGVAMAQRGSYSFADLRDRLIRAIASWETTHGCDDASWSYYERWLCALEQLLSAEVSAAEIDHRMRELAERQAHEHLESDSKDRLHHTTGRPHDR